MVIRDKGKVGLPFLEKSSANKKGPLILLAGRKTYSGMVARPEANRRTKVKCLAGILRGNAP